MFDSRASVVMALDPAIIERQWVARCREGDHIAMANLIERHRARLVRTATNLLRDACEAEDVSQEAFLKAFREIAKLRDDRAFAGYLYRICVRLALGESAARIFPAEVGDGRHCGVCTSIQMPRNRGSDDAGSISRGEKPDAT